jgi:hypothetical protein
VIFPLLVITMMSWTVFWINPKHLAPQVGVSVSSILTLVVFQFTIGSLFPRISYLTRMDKFLVATSLLILFALFEAVASSGLADRGRPGAALALDRVSRVFFPLAFIVFALIVFFA